MTTSGQPGSPRLSCCIVNHNGEGRLRETLGAAAACGGLSETLLLDNGSSDRSVELTRREYPEVRVLELGENLGPAAARNAGLDAATHDLVLFVDNDVRLGEGCASNLAQALDLHPRAAVAMPRVLYADDASRIQYDGADGHFLGLMSLRNADRIIDEVSRETCPMGSVVTACFLLDRAKIRGCQPFDESFFIYLEDHDFALRIRALGHEILSVPRAVCFHGEGTEDLSLRRSGCYARLRVFCLIRNRWQLILKNYGLATLLKLGPMLLVYELFQLVGVVRKGWLREWLRAAGWIARHAPDLARRRRRTQQLRVMSDRELLLGGPIPFADALLRNPLDRAAKRVLDSIATVYWRGVEPIL